MSKDRNDGWVPKRKRSDRARLVAWDTICAVREDDAYANLVLPEAIDRARLNKLDASFATNLTYGTLRLQGRYDAVIARCSQDRPVDDIDAPVLDLLRMGCHQLIELGTPPHAAINETVAIARNELGQGTGGFINAILRRVSERGDWREVLRSTSANKEQFLSVWYSHPRWIVAELRESLAQFGREDALEDVLAADNEPAKVALRARDMSVDALKERIERAKMAWSAPYLVPAAVLLAHGNPGRLWPVQDAAAGIQDEGSQLVSLVFANLEVSAGTDERWLDMCAGPGGKTATIAALAAQRGATVFANEPHAHRLDLVAEAVERFSDIVALREGDGREIGDLEPNGYDRVLVDAPCSGLGALRRRPEARWRKRPEDIEELTQLQGQLLDSAYQAVRPGGVLLYTTCSPVVRETAGVIEAFLARHPEAEVADVTQTANSEALVPVSSTGTTAQLWPDLHHADAMYMARILKK